MDTATTRSSARTTMRSLVALIATAFLIVTSALYAPTPAHAATTPCADDEVTVIVDGFGAGCAKPGGNGYETLRAAGFDVEVTQKFPDFVCRINGSPGPDVDKCLTSSPSDAYWAYWHAPLGGSEWTYSNNGAFTRKPAAGTVDAWMWGAGKAPGAIPVSKSQAERGEESKEPSYDTSAADDQGTFDIPTVDYSQWFDEPTTDNGDSTDDTGSEDYVEEEPQPEENPDNPDELISYQDADGNAITREEYEVIVEEAASNDGNSSNAEGSTNRSDSSTGRTSRTTRSATPTTTSKAKTTVVRTAPGTKKDTDTQASGQDDELQLYTGQPAATTASEDSGSSAWTIALSLALIFLVGAAAAATWVIRKEETTG